jgi:hypothetical protein
VVVWTELDELDDERLVDEDPDDVAAVAEVVGVVAAVAPDDVAPVPEVGATAAAGGADDAAEVVAAPDVFRAIAVPRPRNALVLTAATTRRARQAGDRRLGGRAGLGPAGCLPGGIRSFAMSGACATHLNRRCDKPESCRRSGDVEPPSGGTVAAAAVHRGLTAGTQVEAGPPSNG